MRFTYNDACFATKDGAKVVSNKACPAKAAKGKGGKKKKAKKSSKKRAKKMCAKRSTKAASQFSTRSMPPRVTDDF